MRITIPHLMKLRAAGGTATLSWQPAKDNTLTVWYKVSADGEVLAEAAELSATLPLSKVQGRKLTVQAVDFFENVSEPSEPVQVK